MPATDAFHVRQTMWEDLHTEEFHRFAGYFTRSLRGEIQATDTAVLTGRTPEQIREAMPLLRGGDEFVAREVRVHRLAETFYVARPMTALVTAAAEDWPADETIEPEDWPTDHGIMYVPGGVATLDVRGQFEVTVAFSWEVHGDHTTVVWWTDKAYDSPYAKAKAGWDNIPRFTPWHVTYLEHGSPLPTGLIMGTLIPPEQAEQMRWTTGPNGEVGMTIPTGFTPEQLQPRVDTDRTSAWLVAALRIMQQPLAMVERKGQPAHLRKQLARRPITLRQKAITVIDFRRRVSDFTAGSGREYSHRFLRRGHWRRQPYKREDGSWDRRRVWIHATIVGDPDKPLILRNHVNALTR